MKTKLFTIVFLVIFFLVFVLLNTKHVSGSVYKVLKVNEADWFYLDFNENNNIDSDELVKLKNVNAFSPLQNNYSKEKSEKLEISVADYMKVGYLARNWAKDNLEGNYVVLKSKVKNLKYNAYLVEVDFMGRDLGEFLLSSGLAYINSDCSNVNYLPIQNISQIKRNSKELSALDFLFLNLKSGVIHKPDCKYALLASRGELLLKKKIDSIYHYCKFCFGDKYYKNITYEIPKSNGIYKKSVYKNFGYFEIYLINPLEYIKPNFNCNTLFTKRIIKEINSAVDTIDVALYTIGEQKEIVYALRKAKARGVKIRSVLDYSKNISEIYHETIKFANEFDSHFDKTQILMHDKFFIFDNKKVITGSTNISSTDSGGYNANIALVFNSVAVAKYYLKEFEQMYAGKFSKRKEKINANFVKLGNSIVRFYFLPKDNVNNLYIVPKIKESKDEILISAFYLTDKNIIEEIISAKTRGVKVIILLDALGAINFKNKILQLRNAHIPLKIENWGGKNHEKTIVIDKKILITGSANFSANGLYKNDENVVVIEDMNVALFYRDYFLYLFNSNDDKYLRAFPRAEGWESGNSCHDGVDNNHDGKIDLADDGCKIY